MYVDDTDIMLTTLNETETLEEVFQRALHAIIVWQEGIIISGGDLRPNKCYWSVIDFRWRDGEWSYMDAKEFNQEVWVRDTNNDLRLVKRKNINQSECGLGLHINPDGSMDLQYESIHGKIIDYTSRLQPSALSKHHVIISATTGIFKSIIYTLPGCAFSEKQCHALEVDLYKILLPKMGINSKLPLAYRYGTAMYQGLDMLHIHSQMMIEKLKIFITHIAKDTQLGIMYRATLESLQLELGSLKDVFSLKYWDYEYLATYSWIKVLWFCLDKYDISLVKYHNNFIQQREQDMSLMDTGIRSQLFSREDIRKINNCRLYLQVFFLSDIASGDARLIMHHYTKGLKSDTRVSKWQWPRQQRPNESSWNLWRQAISQVWRRQNGSQYDVGLGNWIVDSHQCFTYSYDPKNGTVLKKIGPYKHMKYVRESQKTRQTATYVSTETFVQSRTRWVPIIADSSGQNKLIAEANMSQIIRILPSSTTTLLDFVSKNYPMYLETFKCSNVKNNGKDFAEAFYFDSLISVTDASVSTITNTGAVSWTIRTRRNKILAEGLSGCPNYFTPHDSYGDELFGIFDILIITKMVIEYQQVTKGTLVIACDNDASLNAGANKEYVVKYNQKCFDLMWAIQDILTTIPITIIAKKVQGHAEKKKLRLNKHEKLNVEMDLKAKQFRSELENKIVRHDLIHFDASRYSIWIHNHRVSCDIEFSIKSFIHGKNMKIKLHEKGDLLADAFDLVDWHAIAQASKMLTVGEKLWIAKFTSGFCATAPQMRYREIGKTARKKHKKTIEDEVNNIAPWNDDLCPLYKLTRENTKHILCCTDSEATNFRTDAFLQLQEWLITQRTNPAIIQCVIGRLNGSNAETFFSRMIEVSTDPIDLQAAQEQDRIGHTHFLFGRISRFWKESQRRYLLSMFPTKNYSADAWFRRFICKIYCTIKSIWKYRCDQVHGMELVMTSKREKEALKKGNSTSVQIRYKWITSKRPAHVDTTVIYNITS